MEQSILLDHHATMTQRNDADFSVWLDPKTRDLPALFKSYKYPVNAWPFLMNQDMAAQL